MTPARRVFLGVCGAGAATAAAWRLLRSDARPAMPPEPASYRAIRRALLDHLEQDVLPFWVSARITDESHGGFVPHLDGDLRPTGAVERNVIVMLRLLWVHAVAIARAQDRERSARLRTQYDRRFDFLRRQYTDEANGGFWSGPPGTRTRLKETRCQVHAVYFLAEMFLLLGHDEALDLAHTILATVDAFAHDPVHGGYLERDEPPPHPPRAPIKTLGVQMHMLLALTRLSQSRSRPVRPERVEELASLLVTRFPVPDSAGNAYNALARDWTEMPPAGTAETRTVYGHSAELIWYVLESARVLGKDVQALAGWARRLADGLLAGGVSERGAVYHAGAYRGAAEDTTVWWWAQAEAMVAVLRVFEVTRDPRYWEAFERIRDWTFRHVVRDRSGTWVAFTDRRGSAPAPLRAGAYWQTGFHATRALVECEQTLGRLLARDEPEGRG